MSKFEYVSHFGHYFVSACCNISLVFVRWVIVISVQPWHEIVCNILSSSILTAGSAIFLYCSSVLRCAVVISVDGCCVGHIMGWGGGIGCSHYDASMHSDC